MARWMPFFALAGLVAAYFGFLTSSSTMAGLGQILFFICVVGVLVSTVLASSRRADG